MRVFSYQDETVQEPVLAIEDRNPVPMLEAPAWYSRAVTLANRNELTPTENVSELVLSQPTSYKKTNIKEKTFTRSSPKEKAAVRDDFDKPKKAENVSKFVFSQPQATFTKKTNLKEKISTRSFPKDTVVDTKPTSSKLVGFANKVYAIILKVLFRNFFFAAQKTKESSTNDTTNSQEKVSQKPSFAKDTNEAKRNPAPKSVPNSTSTEAPHPKPTPATNTTNPSEKARQTPSFTEKPKPKDEKPRAPKTAAPGPKRAAATNTKYSYEKASKTPFFFKMPKPAFAPKRAPTSIDQLASVPQAIRENATYKNNDAFRRLVVIYTRLNGKRKEDANRFFAQKQLMVIFKVDSFAKVKKEYRKLCLLIHPDKALQLGLNEDSQLYLSKLFAFCNSYYSLAT
jgi:hypothetical protein